MDVLSEFFSLKTVKFSLCKIFLGDLFVTFCNLLGMHYLFDRSEVYGIALYNRLPVFLKMNCEFIGCVSQTWRSLPRESLVE